MTIHRCQFSVLAIVLLIVFLLHSPGASQTGNSNTGAGSAEKKYVLDLSGSQDRGVPAGSFNNLAFSLDTRQAVRKVSVKRGEQRNDFIQSYDYADCTKGQEVLLQKPLSGLAPGTPTWLDYVDVEMLPLAQKGVTWKGGVCYGYRKSGGAWHWNLTSTPLTYDSIKGRFRARIWVKEPDVDALKLVFDYAIPPQFVSNVTITVLAPGGPAGK